MVKVELAGDREVVLTRVFRAPLQRVHRAFTDPEILRRWFGPKGWSLETCEVDLRVGGGFRFVLRSPDGRFTGMSGVYRELSGPERSVHTERFDDFGMDAWVTTALSETDGVTTLTASIVYASQEVREAVIRSGMEQGAGESYDRLAEVLAEAA